MGILHHRPAVRLAALAGTLLAGEALGFHFPSFAGLWPWGIGLGALFLLVAYGWQLRHVLFPLVFLAGVLLALHTDDMRQRILRSNSTIGQHRPVLRLRVDGEVTSFVGNDGEPRLSFASHLGPLPLCVRMNEVHPRPTPGDVWACTGWISRGSKAPDRFARHTLWTSPTNRPFRVSSATHTTPSAVYAAFSGELARRAGLGLDWCPETANLNRAILLGLRNRLSRARKATFADAGTVHVFAISGLHVMVVAQLANAFLSRLSIPTTIHALLTVPLVALYTILTGARPSAIRAALMVSFYLLGPVFGRRPNPLAAWALTAIVVYTSHPERIFDLGCTLSFAVMFGIVLWCDWSRRYANPFDAREHEDIMPVPILWRLLRNKLHWFTGALGVSLAAWLAGVPITACAFGRFTPGGLLANTVVVIIANCMVRFGVAGMLCSFICLPLAALCNNAAALCTWIMATVSEKVAALPFSNFQIEPWNPTECVAWYVLWLAVFALLGRFLPRRTHIPRTWWRTQP